MKSHARALFLLLVVTALLIPAGAAFGLPPGGTFIDDDDNVHEAYIEAIAAEGITTGCNPPLRDRYCPEEFDRSEAFAEFDDGKRVPGA